MRQFKMAPYSFRLFAMKSLRMNLFRSIPRVEYERRLYLFTLNPEGEPAKKKTGVIS